MKPIYKLGDEISFTKGTLRYSSKIYTGKITTIHTYESVGKRIYLYFTNAEFNGAVEPKEITTQRESVQKRITALKIIEMKRIIKSNKKYLKNNLKELKKLMEAK